AVVAELHPHVLLRRVQAIGRKFDVDRLAHGRARASGRAPRMWRKSMGVEPTRDCWQPLPDLKSGRPTGTRHSSMFDTNAARPRHARCRPDSISRTPTRARTLPAARSIQ